MKAAIVSGPNQTPTYADFPEPTPGPGESKITVRASALSHLTKGRASGSHYSSSGKFPFVVGVDGVGVTEDGRRVFFALPSAPHGAMAEKTVVRTSQCIPIPDGLDDVTAAALANPGMSSWAALTERAKIVAGETVLINGATGTSGQLSVQIARHLGAKKVIATGRSLEKLKKLGADAIITLGSDGEALEKEFEKHFRERVDIVLDYLWGPSAERLIIAGAKAGEGAVPIRFVQIGSMSGGTISLPGAALRSSAIVLMGSGIGSVPLEGLIRAIGGVLAAAPKSGFTISAEAVPLTQVSDAWSKDESGERVVFTMG